MQRTHIQLVNRFVVATCIVANLACYGVSSTPAKDESAASGDRRTAVPLPAEAQQAVLHEMRQMLGAMGGAMTAAARGDTTAVIAAVAPATTAAAADPAIEALLPAEWKELAERTHGAFDSLTVAVRRSRGTQALKDTVLVRLAAVSGSCTACHESYRVTVK